jgi:hypothetical protein
MKRYVAALLVVLGLVGLVGVLAVGTGFANDENAAEFLGEVKCSEATLHGTYLFAQNGVDIFGKDQVPFAIAGYEQFDGNGNAKAVFSGNFNGKVLRHGVSTGTYSVKANCTGTSTYTDPAEDGKLRSDMFIAPDGSMLTFVQTNPSQQVTAGFEQRATAKRVAP